MADDLASPLGKKKRQKLGLNLTFGAKNWPIGRVMLGLSVLIVAGVVLRIILVDEPNGGQPIVEVPISSTLNSNPLAQEIATPAPPDISVPLQQTPNPVPISLEPDVQIDQPQNERNEFGVFPELMEQTQHGPIPRIGPNGQTPFKAYARPSIGPETAGGKPLIAIVITGMGLNQTSTLDAIANLPDNVSLAFAPYSRTLETTVKAARDGGHEILLEVPMEPFDYPNSDPGPQTLLTGNPARENLDRLFWLMARMGGYIGMINNMGARFTSSATDLGPFMEELGTRGIGYVDDGSSNRSLTQQLALANQVPYARANLSLDENPSRAAILSQLQALEERARQDGKAIGVISALPVSISALTTWSAHLEDKGIILVPISSLMAN